MANEHDLRYKLLFSHKIIVQRFLEGFIDEPFVGQIDFDTLHEEKTNTISDDHTERECDVLWSVLADGTRLYIYILIEFQSTVDRWMPLRFSRYVQRFYDHWAKNHSAEEGLPPLLPILLYNGRKNWTAKPSIEAMVHRHISPKYILRLHYLPIIIRDIPRENLARIHNAVSVIFLAEKLDDEHLDETIREIVDIIKTEFPEARAAVAGWFRNYFAIDGTPDEIVTALEDEGRTRSMLETTIEKWKQQGEEKGREEGRQEGRQEGWQEGRQQGLEQARAAVRLLLQGISAEKVARDTGLPLAEVQELADEINS